VNAEIPFKGKEASEYLFVLLLKQEEHFSQQLRAQFLHEVIKEQSCSGPVCGHRRKSEMCLLKTSQPTARIAL